MCIRGTLLLIENQPVQLVILTAVSSVFNGDAARVCTNREVKSVTRFNRYYTFGNNISNNEIYEKLFRIEMMAKSI